MRALRAAEHGIDGSDDTRAILLKLIERAGTSQALEHALVDCARIEASGKIRQIGKRMSGASRNDRFNRLASNAFQCRECVDDGVALDVELDARTIDRRWT